MSKPPHNNNKASPMKDGTDNPPAKLLDDTPPGNSGTDGGSGNPPPPETLESGEQPLASNSTENNIDRKMTPEEKAHAEERWLTGNTELQECEVEDSTKPTTKDGKEADHRKLAATASHQVQKDRKNKNDYSKSNDTINMDSASSALANLEARFNNPQQSGQLNFLPKGKHSHIKGDLAEKIAADSKIPATSSFKGTSHDSSTFAALSSVEDRLNNPGLSFFPSKSSGQHSSGIIPPTEQGSMPISFSTIEANTGAT
ncbi:expressed unknown protein [Seminavis robusta]|uniref:Uncharacterized protein n=1 Tax=Seminavis robusta TaxID=568900 RepID=A0A9N8E2D8_9STRA|nr:expressed unknown protein [Seminavis robusta]|eukprot:Sro476_g150510.1 n/a (257) ;mRNA; r:4362-5132